MTRVVEFLLCDVVIVSHTNKLYYCYGTCQPISDIRVCVGTYINIIIYLSNPNLSVSSYELKSATVSSWSTLYSCAICPDFPLIYNFM